VGVLNLVGVSVASQLPQPGEPEFPAIVGGLGAFVGAATALMTGGSWTRAQNDAFKYGFWSTAAGMGVYGFGLVTSVY
jgi:hypothetical protein